MKSIIFLSFLASFNALAMEVKLNIDPRLKPYIHDVKGDALYKSTQRIFGCWIINVMDERPVFRSMEGNLSKDKVIFPNEIDFCKSDLVSIQLNARQNQRAFRTGSSRRAAKDMQSILIHVKEGGAYNPTVNVKCKILDQYTANGLEAQIACSQDVHVIDDNSDEVLINLGF